MSGVLCRLWCSLLTVQKPVAGFGRTFQSITRSTIAEGVEVGPFVGDDGACWQDALAHTSLGYSAESQYRHTG